MAEAIHLSDSKRLLLEKYLRGDLPLKPAGPPLISRSLAGTVAPLSYGQQQIWLHAQMAPDLPIYNEPVTIHRSGPLDVKALEQSLSEIIRRHEAWRTTFHCLNGQPVQIVQPPFSLDLPVVDLRGLREPEREAEALRLATEDSRRPFDLERGPLLRAMLVRIGDEQHRLFFTLHQIIFDGISLYNVFLPELTILYDACSAGKPPSLPELPIRYADFVYWQREVFPDDASAELAYWKEQLSGAPATLELPVDRPRPTVLSFRGAQRTFAFSGSLTEALRALSQHEGVTLFMTLLAAFQALLYRYTGQTDIVVGTVNSIRKRPEVESLLGFFLNTLVLRTDLSANPTFRELARRVREVTLGALSHSDVPVYRLMQELGTERDPGRNPLFQAMFVLEPLLPNPSPGWQLTQMDVDTGIARTDLYLELDDRPEGLVGRFRYNTDLFDAATIDRTREHLERLLHAIVDYPDRPISTLPLLSHQERQQLSTRRNAVGPHNSFVRFEREQIEQSICQRFEHQARRHPDRVAVHSRRCEWTYDILNRKGNQVARSLLDLRGAAPENIALVFEQDAPMIAGMLGVLKAGKTYVPIDPHYPRERISYVLDDCQATAILTNRVNLPLATELARKTIPVLNVDQKQTAIPERDLGLSISPDAAAYILYTSGSTGRPKGVVQNHRNVLHFISSYTNALHIDASDQLTLISSYCFDAAVMDVFGALLNGAGLCPIDLRAEGIASLSGWLSAQRITIYHSTPTIYRYFGCSLRGGEDFSSVRLIVLGGEAADKRDVDLYRKHFSERCLFVNGFGPTESTVTLQYFIDQETPIYRASVPVGYPAEETEVLLLDESAQPTDVYGEIGIRSAHLALGYWQRPELTMAAFLPDPQGGNKRIYRTGDMARRLADGSIEFLGRKDFQVKIRGYRIELGEIEAMLAAHPSVQAVACSAWGENEQEKRLVAYVVHHPEKAVTHEGLRGFLERKLPDYMLPSQFVMLKSLPLLPNGKIDRLALRPPQRNFTSDEELAPMDALEFQLGKIWATLLDVSRIGPQDNFFELGGHSLLVAKLLVRLERDFGKRLSMATIFQAPTVEKLARVMRAGESAPRVPRVIPIQPAGSRPSLFCMGGGPAFLSLANRLGSDQPFLGIDLSGLDSMHLPVPYMLEDIAACVVRVVREVQPEGPYYLGGWCLSGLLAYETARQLICDGQEVALLALIDTRNWSYFWKLSVMARVRVGLERVAFHIANLHQDGVSKVLIHLKSRLRSLVGRGMRLVRHMSSDVGIHLSRGGWQDADQILYLAARDYRPHPYPGRVVLFQSSWRPSGAYWQIQFGWRELMEDGLEVNRIPSDHTGVFFEPAVGILATKLSPYLNESQDIEKRKRAATQQGTVDTVSSYGS
jgi:amino acid adenylation domain-containing protein